MQKTVTEKEVKAANRKFYDRVAECYETIDGRRSPTLEEWLRNNLTGLRQRVSGGRLLDIGTGSGFVTRCAKGIFTVRVGIDLSTNILFMNRHAFDLGINADIDSLPFTDRSFDVMTCFAVLHHLYCFEGLVSEIARVLKPGGIFYSEHDLDAAFSQRFRIPLWLYRRLRNAQAKYRRVDEELTPELYELSEYQEQGVNTPHIVDLLEQAHFQVETKFHWFGLLPLLDKLFSTTPRPQSWAPLLSILAVAGER